MCKESENIQARNIDRWKQSLEMLCEVMSRTQYTLLSHIAKLANEKFVASTYKAASWVYSFCTHENMNKSPRTAKVKKNCGFGGVCACAESKFCAEINSGFSAWVGQHPQLKAHKTALTKKVTMFDTTAAKKAAENVSAEVLIKFLYFVIDYCFRLKTWKKMSTRPIMTVFIPFQLQWENLGFKQQIVSGGAATYTTEWGFCYLYSRERQFWLWKWVAVKGLDNDWLLFGWFRNCSSFWRCCWFAFELWRCSPGACVFVLMSTSICGLNCSWWRCRQ